MKTLPNVNLWELGLNNDDPLYSLLKLEEFGSAFYKMRDQKPVISALPDHWNEKAKELLTAGRQNGFSQVCAAFETFGRCLVPNDFLVLWLAAEIQKSFTYDNQVGVLFDPTTGFFDKPKLGRSMLFLDPYQVDSVLAAVGSSKNQIEFGYFEPHISFFPSADPSTQLYRMTKFTRSPSQKKTHKVSAQKWTDLMAQTTLLQSSSMLGLATRVLEMATTHAQNRVVSGQPIGRYQAISHPLVDMLVSVEKLRSTILYAAETHGSSEFYASVAMAKSMANRFAVENTQKAIQIFGAKGFQWDFPLNFFLRRSLVGATLFGTAQEHNSYFVASVVKRKKTSKTKTAAEREESHINLASITTAKAGGKSGSKEVFQ